LDFRVDRAAVSRRQFLRAAGAAAAAPLVDLSRLRRTTGAAEVGNHLQPVKIPEWVHQITSMAFGSAADLGPMAESGVQVLHTNQLWPYYPLIRDGGGPAAVDAQGLHELVAACHAREIKLSLGLPPFPSVALAEKHPQWRIHADRDGSIVGVAPKEDDLGTRLGCNLSPWGDYLIEVCGELVEHFGVDGFSFDGNYHPPICYCPACRDAYVRERSAPLPDANLDDVAYRRYLVWRGEKLEDHYRRLQERIKRANPDAVLMSWTVNAGRYGHFLHSPRAMPTRLNRLFDLPMQEWWLDETNLGASVAPAFGAAYLSAVTGGRPCASEPYLMSRGNPYGTHSFPRHERLARTLLALTHGNVSAQSFGWAGHRESAQAACREVRRRAPWIVHARPMPWGALLVGEQTRQFYAYRNIPELFLPHVFGAFRAALEEHLPVRLLNDWDLTSDGLESYRVLVLPGAAALSDGQAESIRAFVDRGGGLVATGEASLCNEWGEPRSDFALADLFGVSFRGRPSSPTAPAPLDENFARHLDTSYWQERLGVATLAWNDHSLVRDDRLQELVPTRNVLFRGPQVLVSEPADRGEVACTLAPEGMPGASFPAIVARRFGKGKVVYLAPGVDAALWSYSFPYQRRLLARALEWAAAAPPKIRVQAPMCVQAAFYEQQRAGRRQAVIHLYNNLNTTGGHGLPAAEVPLREETVPVSGICITFQGEAPRSCRCEPEGIAVPLRRDQASATAIAELPPLSLHAMLVAEY
jgi:hypothetical protein